jgi:hypothetical protein
MKFIPFVATFALTGCVLPIPTSHVVAPSIHGRVIHAHTGAPVDLAGVIVKGHKEASVLTTRDGSFSTDQITRTKPFWLWWPFASDPVQKIELHIARPGFAKHTEKIEWHPKTQPHVSLSQAIALTPKSAEDAAEELLKLKPH